MTDHSRNVISFHTHHCYMVRSMSSREKVL